MRSYDNQEAKKMGALPWQLELLWVNPPYVHWGPHEDYMMEKGGQWNTPVFFDSWKQFGPWTLDELNECVNFYFSIERTNTDCPECDGDGYNPLAKHISGTFYKHQCTRNGIPETDAWYNKITADEAEMLIQEKRALPGDTADSINGQQGKGGFHSHDAINRCLLIKHRITRELGIDSRCPRCAGHGTVYVAPDTTVSLTLWMLHPRKGCSRGVEVNNITPEDLPAVFEYLQIAAQRNADRFSEITNLSPDNKNFLR